jgi:membrane-associated protease RseP (regulator of RpoE activity)
MADVLANAAGILLLVGLIVLSIGLHEFGHFATAKRFGAKVTEFMIGFGPAVFSRRRGETEYGVKAIPLGGYVRIIGMYPPAPAGRPARAGRMAELVADARRQSLAEVEPGDEDRAFYRLPVRQRVVVMTAGPLMNLLLAVILFTIMLVGVGQPVPGTTLAGAVPCVPTAANPSGAAAAGGGCPGSAPSAAAAAGVAAGDRIVSVGGSGIDEWDALGPALETAEGPTAVVVERDGVQRTLTVDLQEVEFPVVDDAGQPTGETVQRVFLGIRPVIGYESLPVTEVPRYMWDITVMAGGALTSMPQRFWELAGTMVSGGERSPESPVSVVGVSRLGGEIAASEAPLDGKAGALLGLAASLNLFLFLFNLLPVLPLDGGHVAAALWEGARRRLARLRGRPDPGPVDTARLLPLTYAVAVVLVGAGVLVIWADIVKPITLGG